MEERKERRDNEFRKILERGKELFSWRREDKTNAFPIKWQLLVFHKNPKVQNLNFRNKFPLKVSSIHTFCNDIFVIPFIAL